MKDMQINITKSWRKSLSMRFDTHGVLQIKAPKLLLSSQINTFIKKNNIWIEREYSKLQERNNNKKWYLFGEETSFEFIASQSQLPPTSLSLSHLPLSKEAYKFPLVEGYTCEAGGGVNTTELINFYKSQAKNYIIPRCTELSQKYGFSFKTIRITSAATRWGSCSSKKTLNFSYRLVMAPKETIDYVIIHELCHLREMNHSRKFWKQVADIMPEYKEHEKHLKSEGWRYRLI